MARKANTGRVNSRSEKVQYNYDGNAARQLQALPQEMPERSSVSHTTKRNRAKAKCMSKGYVLFLAAVSAAAVCVCVNFLQLKAEITTQTKVIASMETNLSELRADNDALYNSVLASVDLEEVREKAINELGMNYPQEGQIVEFDTAGSSYVRQYKDVPGAE